MYNCNCFQWETLWLSTKSINRVNWNIYIYAHVQLTFAGPAEVDILDNKLKEANIENSNFRLFYSSLFPSPPPKYHDQFTDLLTDISGWPTVCSWYCFKICSRYLNVKLPSYLKCFSSQDETEYLLMSLILLFSPHSLPAAEFDLVERFQLEYFTLLQKYLDKKYG